MRGITLLALSIFAIAGTACAQTERSALERADSAVQANPEDPSAYHARGVAYFFANRMAESVRDFDREIELAPQREPHHWQRGIAQFLAGQFAACQKQFESHRTVNGADMENSLWHFACIARQEGFKAAQGVWDHPWNDGRPTMDELWALYQGNGSVEQVQAAIEGSSRARDACFYGNFYLGMYFDLKDDAPKAKKYMGLAANECPIPHYMGGVARVYSLRLGGAE